MTQALVGSARIEIVGDLSAFAAKSETQIKEVMQKMGVTVDSELAKVNQSYGRAGETAGSAFSTGLSTGTAKGGASVAASATEAEAEGRAAYARLGANLGTAVDEGLRGTLAAGGAGVGGAISEEAKVAGVEGRAKFAEAGVKAGEAFGEGAKESVKGLGSAVIGGAGLLGGAELLKQSVENADKLEASNIKVEGSFGESSKSVQAWAKTMANSYGLSQQAAQDVAGTFGQMFHGMGVGQDESAKMAEKLATLTENVAKFNNADPATVQAAFTAAMRGRGKALLQLGINLDSTTIAAEAMSHGIVKTQVDTLKVTELQDAYAKAVANQQKVDQGAVTTTVMKAGALDRQKSAALALQKAQENLRVADEKYNLVNSSGHATAQQVISAQHAQAQAALSVQQAQQKVTQAQDIYTTKTKGTNATDLEKKIALDQVAAAHAKLTAAMGGSLPTLTQSQKGEAAYYAILDGTKNQENAVADSSKTLAQQKKILAAQVTNLTASFGTWLLPMLTKVATFFTADVIPALKDVGHWVVQNKEWITPLVLALGTAYAAFKLVSVATSAWSKITSGVGAVMSLFAGKTAVSTAAAQAHALALAEGATAAEADAAATQAAAAAQTELDAAMDANPIGLVVAAIAALAVGLIYAWNHSKTFRDIVKETWHDISAIVVGAWKDVIKPTIDALVAAWKGLWGFLQAAWNDVGKPVFDFIGQHWGLIFAGLTGGFSLLIQHWRDVWNFVQAAWRDVGAPVFNAVKTVGKDMFASIEWAYSHVLKPAWNLISGIFTDIENGWNTLWQGLGTIGAQAMGGIHAMLQVLVGIINTGIQAINILINGFNDATQGLSDLWSWTGIPSIPHIPDIPIITLREKGGDLMPGVNIVGEHGMEAILNSGSKQTVIPNPSARHMLDNKTDEKPGAFTDEEFAALLALAHRPQQLVLPDKRVLAQTVNEGNFKNGRR